MSGEEEHKNTEKNIDIKMEAGTEGEMAICEMSIEALLLMMNLSEDDFIINVTLSEVTGDEE